MVSLFCSALKNVCFPKNTTTPAWRSLSHRSHSNKDALWSARAIMATQGAFICGKKIMHASHQHSRSINIKIYQTQLYMCRSTAFWCHGFFVTWIQIHMTLYQMLWMNRSHNSVGWLWQNWPFVTSSKQLFHSWVGVTLPWPPCACLTRTALHTELFQCHINVKNACKTQINVMVSTAFCK